MEAGQAGYAWQPACIHGMLSQADLQQAAILLDRDKEGVRPLIVQELQRSPVLGCERLVRRLFPLAPCGYDYVTACTARTP